MRQGRGPRPPADGFVTIQTTLAVGFSLLLLAALVNLLLFAYGRGVVRAALDEGVRAGARLGAGVSHCQARAEGVVADLLGGAMGAGVGPITCVAEPGRLVATAETTFSGWAPGVPVFTFTTTAVAVSEQASP